jgi:hypothetical protein
MSKHPNAEMLIAIANGYTIQRYDPENNEWVNTSDPLPLLSEGIPLRVSPILVNNFNIPSPVRTPLTYGQKYWIAKIDDWSLTERFSWCGDSFDLLMLSRGIVHLDEQSAIKHATVLISITRVK